MATMKERIGAARDVMHEKHADAADIDGCVRDTLYAAFPELFNGSGWLAPMAATIPMMAGAREVMGHTVPVAVWCGMRDGYLASSDTGTEAKSKRYDK